jgi:parallel beta-helix repeat protein
MKINRFIALFLVLLVLLSGSGIGTAAEIIVQQGQSIQDALNSSVSGDEIIISPGNYTENLRITTSDIIIRSASGNPEDTIVTANNLAEDVFYVEASNVTITGLSINGAGNDRAGVYLIRSNNCTVENNEFSNDALGIYLKNSSYNLILNNIATEGRRAVNVERSNYNTVSGNNVSNQRFGIYFE